MLSRYEADNKQFAKPEDVSAQSLLIAVYRILKIRWKTVALGAAIGLVFAILLGHLSSPVYVATMTYTNQEEENNSLGSAAASVASTLGFGATNDHFSMEAYTSLLTDPALMDFMNEKEPDFLRVLYADQWDIKSKSWHPPRGLLAALRQTVKVVVGIHAWEQPTPEAAAITVKNILEVSDDRKTGFRTLKISGDRPERPLKLLVLLNKNADRMVRDIARDKSQRRVNYLIEKLKGVSEISQRDGLSILLREEEHKLMLSEIDKNYAIRLVTPPEVSPIPESTRIKIYLVVGLLLGLFVGAISAIYSAWSQGRRNRPGQTS